MTCKEDGRNTVVPETWSLERLEDRLEMEVVIPDHCECTSKCSDD